MSEEIINEIISNPRLLDKITSVIYEKMKNDIILQRLTKLEETVATLTRTVQENNQQIVLIWKKLDEMENEMRKRDSILEEHSKRIEELTKRVEELAKRVEEHSKILEEHSKRIEELSKRIEEHSKILEEHSKRIEELTKAFLMLKVSFDSFTSRAGIYVQRTLMELYKEALKSHGVDPSNVKHGYIVDDIGVIEKGRRFEVDFYETNDEIRLFEIKNLGDMDGIEQLIVRRRILESKGNKKQIKMYLVCNSIPKKVLLKAKKEGIVVIAGNILGERSSY